MVAIAMQASCERIILSIVSCETLPKKYVELKKFL